MTHPKHAATDHDVLDLIRHRWSPRAFDPAREIPARDLRSLFEAARWAPSSFNEQPWRFIVADRQKTPGAFAAMLETLFDNNRAWAGQASALVLVATSMQLQSTGHANRNAGYDAGQAVAFLLLQATSLGLSVRQMEGFNRDAVRAACAIPSDYEPLVVMAIGYTGDPTSLQIERHRTLESQPRQRRSIDTFVFEGTWGRTAEAES